MNNALAAAVTTRRNLKSQLLEMYPSLAEDDPALLDTLSGLDDLEEQCIAVLRHAIEREAMGKALAGLIEDMSGRKRRLEDGARSLRAAVLQAMSEAGVSSIRAPDMSLSIGRGKPKIVIVDEAELPDAFVRIRRDPNKTEIAAAFARGERVPGAELGNVTPFLSVHRS